MHNPFENIDARLRNIEALLLDLKHPDSPVMNPEADQLFSTSQAADFLKLAKPTVYSMVSRGFLPANKRGSRLYFLRQELIEWVKEGKKKNKADLEDEVEEQLASVKRKRGKR